MTCSDALCASLRGGACALLAGEPGGRLWVRQLAVISQLLEPALLASEVMDIVKYVI